MACLYSPLTKCTLAWLNINSASSSVCANIVPVRIDEHNKIMTKKQGINIKRKDVARCYRLIYRELELKMPVVDPVKVVSRIASIAELGEKTKRKAITILNEARRTGLTAGKDPMGIAAAALYLACISTGEIKSQKEISIASGITEVTIRNRCAGLRKMLNN